MEVSASAFNGSFLVKVENVAQKLILIIDLKSLSYILLGCKGSTQSSYIPCLLGAGL